MADGPNSGRQTDHNYYIQYKELARHFGEETRYINGTGVHAMDFQHFCDLRNRYRETLIPTPEPKKRECLPNHPIVIDRLTKLGRLVTQDDIHRMEAICASYDAILRDFTERLHAADYLRKQLENTYGR